MGISLAYLPIKAAKAFIIDVYNEVPLRLPMIQHKESWTLH